MDWFLLEAGSLGICTGFAPAPPTGLPTPRGPGGPSRASPPRILSPSAGSHGKIRFPASEGRTTVNLDLSTKDLRIMVQSLENCLATCQTHQKKPDAPCEDCDAARALQDRLRKQLKA
jgi:hypothetical protein